MRFPWDSHAIRLPDGHVHAALASQRPVAAKPSRWGTVPHERSPVGQDLTATLQRLLIRRLPFFYGWITGLYMLRGLFPSGRRGRHAVDLR